MGGRGNGRETPPLDLRASDQDPGRQLMDAIGETGDVGGSSGDESSDGSESE